MRTLAADMGDAELRAWLIEEDPVQLDRLYTAADAARSTAVGPEVHLRGLIEISNACTRACAYCGISVHNHAIQRYRMGRQEILDCARRAKELGYGTVVMQAGEDPLLTRDFIADLVRTIKRETGLAVTLSLGERSREDLIAWRAAGADRYLLRFETSNPALFARIHPAGLVEPTSWSSSVPGKCLASPCCVSCSHSAIRPAPASWSASPVRRGMIWSPTCAPSSVSTSR